MPICEKYSCGAVQLASLNGCLWWEVNANVVGEKSATDKSSKVFGLIRTTVAETAPREITTVLLISQEPIDQKHAVTNIAANCHHEPANEKLPSSTYRGSSN